MPRGKNKHLTIEDRVIIQNALDTGESFASAARRIGVSTSTVTREVAANRTFWVPKGKAFWNLCVYRRVLPKGTCFEELTQHDVSTVASAVNNYPRRSLGDKTPLQASAGLLPKELLDELGIVRMRPDEVVLKPSLFDCGK